MIESAHRVLHLMLEVRGPAEDPELAPDWGVPLLTTLTTPTGAQAVVLAWAADHRSGRGHPGLFGRGMAGTALGMSHAARVEPRLARLAVTARDAVVRWAATAAHRRTGVTYGDYDLIVGASGAALALSALPDAHPDHVSAVARYLAELCDDAELPRLRIGLGAATPRTSWNVGRVNHGLAHGAPGILAALIAAWPLLAESDRDCAATAIRNLTSYLLSAHSRDDRGVLSWSRASGEDRTRAQHRQAWCYGTPGVAWQLTEAGRVVGDAEPAAFGVAAMASLCDAWDDDYYLDDAPGARLALCHGAAGIVAIADAFAIHAGLEPAARLADHLAAVLHASIGKIHRLAEADLTMITGASGILAVMLSREPGRRDWMRAIGLR